MSWFQSSAPEDPVVIVVGRCAESPGLFGIRFETKGGRSWRATWAFPIRERAAMREAFSQRCVSGRFEFAPEFPGCPHCRRSMFVRCDCGTLSCWGGESGRVRCAGCGRRGEVDGVIDSLSGQRDV